MSLSKDAIVSAQVILQSASGRAIDGRVVISADNLAQFAPSPGVVSSVAAEFRSRGFEVGPFVGVSFSVTATIRAFEEFFGRRIRLGRDRAYEFVGKSGAVGHELLSEGLPEVLRKSVHAVVFPLRPDFGPTEFHL